MKMIEISRGVDNKLHVNNYLDASTYEALTKLAQDFYCQVPEIDFHGACGSIDGSASAAYRYTESRLSKYSMMMLDGLKKKPVDYEPNYTNTEMIPKVLPSPSLNLLINGSFGIASGFIAGIPTHNVNDICDMVIKLINNPDIPLREVAESVLPDFPTGGIICNKDEVIKAYCEGSGNCIIRAKCDIVKNKNGTSEIIVREIPFMKTIGPRQSANSSSVDGGILNSIANNCTKKGGTIDGINDIHDLSNKEGICIKIFIKKGYDPEIILNQLYDKTALQTTCKISLVCLNDGIFSIYDIKTIFDEFIEFRFNTIRNEINNDLNSVSKRIHILNGLLLVVDFTDEIVNIIKKSKERSEAMEKIRKKYNLSKIQTEYILDMKLSQLTSLGKKAIKNEYDEKLNELEVLKEEWKDENINKRIIREQEEIKKNFGKPRKTELCNFNSKINIEDIIPDEPTTILLTSDNFISRIHTDNIKTNKRGASRGTSLGNKEISEIFNASTKDHLLCFTNLGRVYDIKTYVIKETSSAKDKGLKIESYLDLKQNETVNNILCISETQFKDLDSYLLFLTKNGMIKKTQLSLFNNIRTTGIIATSLRKDDELLTVKYIDSSSKSDVLIATKNGMAIRYSTDDFTTLNRDCLGVKSMSLSENDSMSDMVIVNDDSLVFFATQRGSGKTVKIKDLVTDKEGKVNDDGFPILKRDSSRKGRIAINLNKNDYLVSLAVLNDNDLIIITNKKLISVEGKEFKEPLKRNTKGKRIIKLQDDEFIKKVILK